jgi:uncharacterized radical SAM protein YgiQ
MNMKNNTIINQNLFLPINREEMKQRGWEQPDFILVTADAYVDHPSFAHAVISRILERHGYNVAILSQPDWKNGLAFTEFGRPRLAFLVSGGNIDSMVCHYTANKRKRKRDEYSPGGEIGHRPDRPVIVYSNCVREQYKDVPIIIGGLEASLRRFAHYDYWTGKVRRSILFDSRADLLMFGMGERSMIEIADALNAGLDIADLTFIPGTAYTSASIESVYDFVEVPSYESITESKKKFADAYQIQLQEQDGIRGRALVQSCQGRYVVQNKPQEPLSGQEMDDVYELPYVREANPVYDDKGGVPALTEVKFSIVSGRGCFGSCSFCAITYHQGRILQARSHESILREVQQLMQLDGFKGYIHDVGGPTANFRQPACAKQLEEGTCSDKMCLYPKPCKNLTVDHSDYIVLLQKIRALEGIKKVFVRSGIRYDYVEADPNPAFIEELVRYHVSGQLKVAPEHASNKVLRAMGKPSIDIYRQFKTRFERENQAAGLKQYIIPYFIAAHPGCGLNEAIELAEFLRDEGFIPDQVQDFYPTPGSVSTCMYYTGIDPRNMRPIYVPKSEEERAMQRALLQYNKPKNQAMVIKALKKANRQDLIGFGKQCLVKPINH